jgi:hypothetical protein
MQKILFQVLGEGDTRNRRLCSELAGRVRLCNPPVSVVMRTIRKAALVKLSGLLIIPLWKNSKFWTYAFRDGIHLNEMFDSVQIVRMHASAWELVQKGAVRGREIQLLCMKFGRSHGSDALESLKGPKKCFRGLFGKVCEGCKAV